MKERPILFSGAMVRAILEGRKTQTRREVKRCGLWESTGGHGMRPMPEACPYGQPGDRLWVRETWGCKTADRPGVPDGRRPQSGDAIQYAANDADAWQWREPGSLPWRPSIHMPRWACRLVLEVTGVRVERLQAISATDAWAEGIAHSPDVNPVHEFEELWASINGQASWDANPWVWVVEFRRAEA